MPLRGGQPRGAARLSSGSRCLQGEQTTFESLRPIPGVRAGSTPTAPLGSPPQQRHSNTSRARVDGRRKAKADEGMVP